MPVKASAPIRTEPTLKGADFIILLASSLAGGFEQPLFKL